MTTLGYNVEVDSQDVDTALALFKFIGGNTNQALRVAINKAGPKVRAESSRRIREQVRLKQRYVNDRLKFVKATNQRLVGRITTNRRGVLLTRYSTDSNVNPDKVSWLLPPPVPKRGVRVKVKPTGGTQVVEGRGGELAGAPFYMVLPKSRQLAIVGRRSTSGAQGGQIKVLYGPSLSQVFNDVRNDVIPVAQQTLEDEALQAVRFLLVRQFPK